MSRAINMSDRVRDHGEGLIIGFPTENVTVNSSGLRATIETLKGYFFKVSLAQDYYQLYDQLGTINSGASSDYDYLGDSGHGSGNDVLRIANDDWHAIHFGVGLEHPDLRVYEKVDPSSPNTALDRDSFSSNPDPTAAGDDFDYYDGTMQGDKYDPPVRSERVSFRNDDDGQFLQFGFRNEGPDNLSGDQTNLHLVGRAYKLVPVTNSDTQEKMLQATIQDDPDPTIPTTMVQVGGLRGYNLGTAQPDDWDDAHARPLDYAIDNARV